MLLSTPYSITSSVISPFEQCQTRLRQSSSNENAIRNTCILDTGATNVKSLGGTSSPPNNQQPTTTTTNQCLPKTLLDNFFKLCPSLPTSDKKSKNSINPIQNNNTPALTSTEKYVKCNERLNGSNPIEYLQPFIQGTCVNNPDAKEIEMVYNLKGNTVNLVSHHDLKIGDGVTQNKENPSIFNYNPTYLDPTDLQVLCTDIVSRQECARGLEKKSVAQGVNVFIRQDGKNFTSSIDNRGKIEKYDGIPTETIRKVIKTVDGHTGNSSTDIEILLANNPQFQDVKKRRLTPDYSLNVVVSPEDGRVVILINEDALKQKTPEQIASEVKLVLNNYCARDDAEGKRRCLKNSSNQSTSNSRTGIPTSSFTFGTNPNFKIDPKYEFNYGNK